MTLKDITTPLIIGHRGYRKRYPENTLSAFSAAFDAGAQMIEFDVTLTKDRQVVIMHDTTLNRTTNGRGRVDAYNLSELKSLDAGSWFHRQFRNERIPVLEEVLDLCPKKGLFNIEIKSHPHVALKDAVWLAHRVVALLKHKKMMDRALISSFAPDVLKRMARMPDPPALAVLSDRNHVPEALSLCQEVGAFSWHPDFRRLKEGRICKMHAAGIKVFPYTVNTHRDVRRLLGMGVDGLFTDDPPLVVACLAQ